MAKKTLNIFTLLLLIFIVTRLIILMTSLDLYDFEEIRMGMSAKEILSGATIPYFAELVKNDSHVLGILVNSIFIAGFYKLFGESGVSLKLCWLFFSAGIFVILFFMMSRYFGQKVAVITSILYILAPPVFTWYNLADTGDQKGALFFRSKWRRLEICGGF